MKELTDWRAVCAPGGWVRVKALTDSTTVYMRLRGSGAGPQQRLNVHTVVMDSPSPISTHVWRYVPFQAVEEAVNGEGVLGQMWDAMGESNPYLEVLLRAPHEEPVSVEQLERHFGSAEELRGADDPKDVVVPGNMIMLSGGPQGAGERPPRLSRPAGRITDDFLRDLARTYKWLVATGHNAPATVIADETNTPVATVRRWISNARQRQFLPPGRPGRAG
ncbi:hypothetical protein LG634_14540 [Streptomyces bambusae]|uniref:hypothetical protein n=1 Tax=Streptomyces bambusae TaxID=1550616 RepID=UPI001CFC7136|nr:hypothetical protein [Streptomyces bambusae]MCB5166050.1 hypothetical protein [Streptomyces bambusae]